MSCADRMATSRLMRTCRILNHEGAKHLFRDTPWIMGHAAAISFTQYAFARADVDEMAHRMHWLRSLHLSVPRCPDSCPRFARTMAFFLSHFAIHAPNFVELELGDSEDLLSADADLAEVISAIARLQKLTLGSAGPQASKMLRHSKFRLWFADIAGHEQPAQSSANDNPVFALHNSCDTLQVLSLERVTFDRGSDHHLPCYPNLARLDLATSLAPSVYRLAQAFPNLRTLNVNTDPGYSYLNAVEREETRQANMVGQAQHDTFHALRSYSGSILSLYLFGLTCRIPFVNLRDDEDEPCWDVPMLQAICAKTRPAHLELYISYISDFLSQAEDFVQLCANEDFRTTRTLTLTFDIFWAARNLDFVHVLECIYSAVRASSLRAVELILDWQCFWEDCFDEDPHAPPAAMFLRLFDPEAVADKLLETTEMLKTAVICLKTFGKPDVTAQRGPDINYNDGN
ncbi:hypothetical protein LXA43DRAFT_1058870 [Ganoderma leucocontextum]|nr:hypothetical protein LXA43DRAFT_1058870 [Ganoderma leucocontextum]